MAKQKETKTNAIRVLETAHAEFKVTHFSCPEALSGVEVACLLEIKQERMFKTLVTQGRSGEHYVFMVPVAEELDLKKAAYAVGEKAIAMIKSRDLLPLTGYIHGGCSPIGMKKFLRTTVDETALLFDTICFSGGKLGCQIEMPLSEAQRVIPLSTADLTVS